MMAQLTVYVDDDTRARIDMAAAQAKTSVSRWVQQHLVAALDSEWPAHYFDEVVGSLRDDADFERPPQGRLDDDVRRASW